MSETSFKPVRRRSLRENVFKALRQAILRGELKPGDRLREAQIAEQMGVSRAPLREAIRDLASEGLVVSNTYRGAYVAELSKNDLWEIYSLRAALERMAVEILTPGATPSLIEALRQSIDNMVEAANAGDTQHLVELDLAFHRTLVCNAKHSRLVDIWDNMVSQIRICMDLVHHHYQPLRDMIDLHALLVDQIAQKQAKEAGETLARHILDAGERICREG